MMEHFTLIPFFATMSEHREGRRLQTDCQWRVVVNIPSLPRPLSVNRKFLVTSGSLCVEIGRSKLANLKIDREQFDRSNQQTHFKQCKQ